MSERGAPRIAIVAGEHSGDQLAGSLMRAIRSRAPAADFVGVGGERMEAAGLESYFPMSDIIVNGIAALFGQLPKLLGRISETAGRIIADRPDALVIVDSPEFTHRVARRVRKALPDVPIINYAPPTVWAVRPWRARSMRAYVDRSMALMPFEPEAHERLGGPPCDYVGSPIGALLAGRKRASEKPGKKKTLLALPGSRATEIFRHMDVFGEAVAKVWEPGMRVVIPAVSHLERQIRGDAASWAMPVEIVTGEAAKWRAFSQATAALAASGTVTLELALLGVPHVVGYRVDMFVAMLKPLLRVHSVAMSNLVHGSRLVPEFIHKDCTADNLAAALGPLLVDTPARRAQIEGFARIRAAVDEAGPDPAGTAADIVLKTIAEKKKAAPEGAA
ncbi:MAG: lipid-A-disaccharide synthase [Flavobacteriaceae bacterium]